MQGKLLARVLQKMRRVAVSIEGRVIRVLLINKKTPRLAAVAMHNIHQAARFFTRFGGQDAEYLCGFGFMAGLGDPDYGKCNHLLVLSSRFSVLSRLRSHSLRAA